MYLFFFFLRRCWKIKKVRLILKLEEILTSKHSGHRSVCPIRDGDSVTLCLCRLWAISLCHQKPWVPHPHRLCTPCLEGQHVPDSTHVYRERGLCPPEGRREKQCLSWEEYLRLSWGMQKVPGTQEATSSLHLLCLFSPPVFIRCSNLLCYFC